MTSICRVNDKISYYENETIDSETFEGRKECRDIIAVRVSSAPFAENNILREISGRHQGIITYHGNFEKDNLHFMWMEYYNGTLKDVSFTKDDSKLGKDKTFLGEITETLHFLHTNLIALDHFDAESFLLTKDGKTKISIFQKAELMPFGCMNITAFANNIQDLGNLFKFVLTKNPKSDILYDKVLAEKLIALMTHKDPKQRPTTAEILAHPYFWDCNKKLKLINVIKKYLDLKDVVANALQLAFDGDTTIIDGDWTKDLDSAILDDLRVKFRKHEKQKTSHLLIFMRNKDEHSSEWSPELKNVFGNNTSDYMQFWDTSFPRFFNHIHEAIKTASKDNEAIRKIFEEFLFVPSTMIDSLIPCVFIDTSKNYEQPNQPFSNICEVNIKRYFRIDEKLSKFFASNKELSFVRLIDSKQSFIGFVQIINLAPKLVKMEFNGQKNVLCEYELEIKLFQKIEASKIKRTRKIHENITNMSDEYLTRVNESYKKVVDEYTNVRLKLSERIDRELALAPEMCAYLNSTMDLVTTRITDSVPKTISKNVVTFKTNFLAILNVLMYQVDDRFVNEVDRLLIKMHESLANSDDRLVTDSLKDTMKDLMATLSNLLTDFDDQFVNCVTRALSEALKILSQDLNAAFEEHAMLLKLLKC